MLYASLGVVLNQISFWFHLAPAANSSFTIGALYSRTLVRRDFPRLDFGDPPSPLLEIEQNYLLVFYSQLLKRVPVVLCLGALTGPRENPPSPPLEMEQNSLYWTLIANLWGGYCFVLCLRALTGPGEFCSILRGGSPKCILGKTHHLSLKKWYQAV